LLRTVFAPASISAYGLSLGDLLRSVAELVQISQAGEPAKSPHRARWRIAAANARALARSRS
jgi:hypothetical protein